MGWIDYIS